MSIPQLEAAIRALQAKLGTPHEVDTDAQLLLDLTHRWANLKTIELNRPLLTQLKHDTQRQRQGDLSR